ncbi:MAG: hypothetical protein EZS28_048167 [Streblomastix strix]|uniref:Uncharacterized protein n=2 Tax=Streblomastix strix TaxID=222440 RepID=A0A5J4TCZ3_9EUKA|nr:MAG: hypothetical protein EZS28_048167 [Streblomastix strix]
MIVLSFIGIMILLIGGCVVWISKTDIPGAQDAAIMRSVKEANDVSEQDTLIKQSSTMKGQKRSQDVQNRKPALIETIREQRERRRREQEEQEIAEEEAIARAQALREQEELNQLLNEEDDE